MAKNLLQPPSALRVIGAIAVALLGILAVGSVAYYFFGSVPPKVADVQQNEDGQGEPTINTVYGSVANIDGSSLTVAVEMGTTTIPFLFTYGPGTAFSSFGYANDDDLVGTEVPILATELAVGDTVAVYVASTLDSAAAQPATRVIKLNQ